MTITATDVTVCVVVKDRVAMMTSCLDSIEAQTVAPAEVVVVDNGSTDGTFELLQSRDVTLVRDGGSLGAIRNLAVRTARTPVVAFIDSDCVAAPDWLERLAAGCTDDLVCVQGRTIPNPDHDVPWWSTTQTITSFSGRYEACNIAYLRQVLLEHPFDEQIGYPGEDTAAGWSIERAGGQAAFVEDAVVLHAVVDGGLRGQLSKTRRYGSLCYLLKRFPEKRAGLVNHVFLTHRTRSTWAALIGVLLLADAVRSFVHGGGVGIGGGVLEVVLAIAALRPWVRRSWPRDTPVGLCLRALGGRVRIDLAMVRALLVGSLKHRCLVL